MPGPWLTSTISAVGVSKAAGSLPWLATGRIAQLETMKRPAIAKRNKAQVDRRIFEVGEAGLMVADFILWNKADNDLLKSAEVIAFPSRFDPMDWLRFYFLLRTA
jgi:hypothetical protein